MAVLQFIAVLICEAELLSAIQTSLRNKVASLEEDNWMFEAEQEAPG